MNDPEFEALMLSIEAPTLKPHRPSCSMGANGCIGVTIEHHVAHVNYLTEENDALRRLLKLEAARRSRAWFLASVAVLVAFLALVIR